LTDEEVEKFGIDFLLASKLYRMAETPKATGKPSVKVIKEDPKE
jgi:hypothetical protein